MRALQITTLILALMTAGISPVFSEANGSICSARLKNFVTELDQLLDSNPHSVTTVTPLLAKYFPLTGCDIAEAVAISRQSKYLKDIWEQPISTSFYLIVGPAFSKSFFVVPDFKSSLVY